MTKRFSNDYILDQDVSAQTEAVTLVKYKPVRNFLSLDETAVQKPIIRIKPSYSLDETSNRQKIDIRVEDTFTPVEQNGETEKHLKEDTEEESSNDGEREELNCHGNSDLRDEGCEKDVCMVR